MDNSIKICNLVAVINKVFNFKKSKQNNFQESFNNIKEFINTNNRLPIYTEKDEYNLYYSLLYIKDKYKNNKLTEEQINQFFAIDLIKEYLIKSNVNSEIGTKFETAFNKLQAFYRKEKNSCTKIVAYQTLYYFKNKYEQNKLTKEQVNLLFSIKLIKNYLLFGKTNC